MADSFEDVKAKCDVLMASIPSMDYSSMRNEVKDICSSVSISSSTMAPADLAGDMERIQAARDRMVEIVADAHMRFVATRDISKMMQAVAKKTSAETSSDRRDGDAIMRVSDYSLDATKAESFYKFCEVMYDGLNNKYNSVGKRIACLQESVRMHAFGNASMAADLATPRDTSKSFNSSSSSPKGGNDGSTKEMDWNNL